MNGRMVIWMRWIFCIATLLCTTAACEDWVEVNGSSDSDTKSVEVTVNLGFAEEESEAIESATHQKTVTRTTGITTPDGLYELNVFQFTQDGVQLDANGSTAGKTFYQNGKINAGSKLTFSLTQSDNCRLVIIARGEGASSSTMGDQTYSSLQSIAFNRNVINSIPASDATQSDMNKMPYVLYLEHVKVTTDGKLQSPDIESPDGPQDVRLLLKRLAAKVTVKWNYNVTVGDDHYTLKQLLLQDVPLNFNYIPKPDADGVYPNIIDQYTTLEVSGYDVSAHQTDGAYSFWVPANVRKDKPKVTSASLRIKANASEGSSYLTFVAVNDKDAKKKFSYRIYLGDSNPANFSIKSNTDYIYHVNFAHTTIPASDRRVTFIDPIPASENNDNLVPTANCFMVAPGGAFCFDPFEFQQNGTSVPNTVLKNWCASGGIKSVRLLWQTKENGDLGEPVMGIVNAANDHTNIVDVKKTDANALSTPATDKGQCRIYCRVAPNTSGGSGVIAAYDGENGTGNILWSWHVWVTDYNPDITGSATILEPVNKRKFRLKNVSTVMMDRNLGAYDGAVAIPATTIERSRTSGFHYQKGRKDPFPSSYTNKSDLPDVYTFVLSETSPPEHVMNRYNADGIHAIVPKNLGSGVVSLQTAYRNPVSIAGNNSNTWCSEAGNVGYWSTTKNVHDPCPAGWRVLERADLEVLQSCTPTVPGIENGGILLHYDDTQNGTYLRYTGYPPSIQQLNYVGKRGFLSAIGHENIVAVVNGKVTVASMKDYDAHTTRCVQERVD